MTIQSFRSVRHSTSTTSWRCWWHKQVNIHAAPSKSARPGAAATMKEIYNTEGIDHAQLAIKVFEIDYAAKYPKAVAKIAGDVDALQGQTA